MGYKNILVAVDMKKEAVSLVNRAKLLLEEEGGSISLLHAAPALSALYPVHPMGAGLAVDVEKFQLEYSNNAKDWLKEVADETGISCCDSHLLMGNPASNIKEFARENDVDLIVIGLHEEKGIERFVSSEANGVMHSVPCDVLTVLL